MKNEEFEDERKANPATFWKAKALQWQKRAKERKRVGNVELNFASFLPCKSLLPNSAILPNMHTRRKGRQRTGEQGILSLSLSLSVSLSAPP